jgi:hypothetical protein
MACVNFCFGIHLSCLLQVANDDGSYINKADVSVFPVSTEMSGALVRIAPGRAYTHTSTGICSYAQPVSLRCRHKILLFVPMGSLVAAKDPGPSVLPARCL